MGIIDAFTKVYKNGEPIRISEAKYEDKKRNHWRENLIYKLESGEIVAIFRNITEQVENKNKLEEKILELETLNNFMVERELKMIELKKEIESLKKKIKN